MLSRSKVSAEFSTTMNIISELEDTTTLRPSAAVRKPSTTKTTAAGALILIIVALLALMILMAKSWHENSKKAEKAENEKKMKVSKVSWSTLYMRGSGVKDIKNDGSVVE
jgi:hypothetical protein